MKYYPTYKDSNINWAMSIPATWKVQKIKYGLLFRQGGAWGTDPADNEFDCPCIRVADFDYAHLCVLDREYTVRNYSTAQIEKLTLSYVHIQWADNIPYYLSLTVDGHDYFTNKKAAKKAERKLSRREWRIAVISAIIGGMVGLIPWICTLIGGGQ